MNSDKEYPHTVDRNLIDKIVLKPKEKPKDE